MVKKKITSNNKDIKTSKFESFETMENDKTIVKYRITKTVDEVQYPNLTAKEIDDKIVEIEAELTKWQDIKSSIEA